MKLFSQEEKEKQRTESHKSRVERDFCLNNLENREEKEKWKYNSTARERKIWVISSRDFLKIETLVNDWSGIPHLHNLLSTFNPQRIQDDWNKFQRQHFWFYPTVFWLSFLPKTITTKSQQCNQKRKGNGLFLYSSVEKGRKNWTTHLKNWEWCLN